MKKLIILFIMVSFVVPFLAHAEDKFFDFGRFNFSLSPKILKDGSITDISFGIMYTEKAGSQLRFRYTNISKNEELLGVVDSLNAVTERTFEFFILPINYYFIKNKSSRLWSAAGLYYSFEKLTEKGFFNMPELENFKPPRERVNSFTNNFSVHVIGPLIDSGISYSSKKFSISFSGGIIPVFYLKTSQKITMIPLLDPNHADYSQNTYGSPQFYINLDSILLKYINLAFLYNYTRVKYRALDFDENFTWIIPERTIITQEFKIEASALLPLSDDMFVQAGYGYTFDNIRLNSGVSINDNRRYLILTVKKTGN